MSIEDFALRFEGLSEQQIVQFHAALNDTQALMVKAQVIIGLIETELPRIKRTVQAFESILATINANQTGWGQR